jgi:hypothetical protein
MNRLPIPNERIEDQAQAQLPTTTQKINFRFKSLLRVDIFLFVTV